MMDSDTNNGLQTLSDVLKFLNSKQFSEDEFEKQWHVLELIFSDQIDPWERCSSELRLKISEIVSLSFQFGFSPDHEQCDEKEEELHRKSKWPHISLNIISMIIRWLNQTTHFEDKGILRNILLQSFIIGCFYSHEEICAIIGLNSLAQGLLKGISNLCVEIKISSFKEILNVDEMKLFGSSFREEIFTFLQPKLSKDTWHKNEGFVTIFHYFVTELQNRHIVNLVDRIIPVSLLLVDNYEQKNQILGIQCLHKLMKATSGPELTLYGKADVIYSALNHKIHTREYELIVELYPALLAILSVVEKPLEREDMTWSKHDSTLQHVLNEMEFEQSLELRRAYSKHLYIFIDKMKIDCLKHMKRLKRVIENYLEISDGEHEETRINILTALQSLFQNNWPRIFSHIEHFMKILIKLLYSMDTLDIPSQTKDKVMNMVGECIQVFRKVDEDNFNKLCSNLNFHEVSANLQNRWLKCTSV